MRERALIHIAGPAGAGKTTFVERLLDAEVAFAICMRAERDPKLRKELESAPKANAELRRYRETGAAAAALFRFAERSWEAFFGCAALEDYSEAIFIEGDCPIDHVDLSVFVAPPPERSILRRVSRDHETAHRESIEYLDRALESPAGLADLMRPLLGDAVAAMAGENPQIVEEVQRSMASRLDDLRQAPPPRPTDHWTLADGYEGIQRAQLIVANCRSDDERSAGEQLCADVTRLRKDEAVYRDVIGPFGSKVPVTAVVADLANAKDAGLKKALGRVRRTVKQRLG